MDALKRLKRARSRLSMKMPFFGHLLLQCKLREEPQIPTMATDGKDIFYNTEFVDSLNPQNDDEELKFVLVHEVMHKVFSHVDRLRGRNKERFNVAADYVINDFISKAGLQAPKGVLIDKDYNSDWTADAVYEDLVKKFDPDGQDNPDHLLDGSTFKPSDGESAQGQAQDQATARQREMEMQSQLTAAADSQKRAGLDCPSVVKKLVEEFTKPKVDWKRMLREFVISTGKSDATYRRPQRRVMAHDMYLPILESEECPHLCIVFDTSGSIYCQPELTSQFIGEVNGIIEDVPPEKLTVIHTDTRVRFEQELEKGEMIDNGEFIGGGGTDFREVMDHIAQMETQPAAVVFFTDLYCTHGVNPDIPVMWIVYENPQPTAPYGDCVVIENDK